MKTLIATALLAALAITGFAKADEPTKTTTPVQSTEKKVTIEELGSVLERMGYNPKSVKDKEGKVFEYQIDITRGSTTIPISLSLSPSGTRVWMNVGIAVFDAKYPATQELLLELLSKHDELWPAYIGYLSNHKYIRLSMAMDVTNFGSATLRPKLDQMFDKALIVLDAMKKVQAAQQKAKEGGTQTAPNPIP